MSSNSPFSFSTAWLAGYLIAIALVIGGLWYGRQRALAIYGSASSQTEWEQWRHEAKKLAEDAGPVKRRIPKSTEPPALVLMRDHFVTCLIGSVVLTSVLFGAFMIFVRGALGDSATVRATNEK